MYCEDYSEGEGVDEKLNERPLPNAVEVRVGLEGVYFLAEDCADDGDSDEDDSPYNFIFLG